MIFEISSIGTIILFDFILKKLFGKSHTALKELGRAVGKGLYDQGVLLSTV
jgi:hypothetical protein